MAWAGEGEGERATRAFFEQVQSLRAHFTQELVQAGSGTLQRSSGEVVLQRPGRFRWDYREPFRQVIVADGERLWFYDTDLEQVTVKDLEEGLGGTPAALLTSRRPLDESFKLAELPAVDGLARAELRPKARDGNFESIQLGFRGGELESMEIIDSFGQLTRLGFSAVERNPKLDPALFRFTPPAGVDVIGDR